MRYVIALDVGGTGMKAALMGADGELLHRDRRPTPRTEGPEASAAAVTDFADALRHLGVERYGRQPAAVGAAVPGILDEPAGVVRYAANLGWRDLPLRALLADRLARPADGPGVAAVGTPVALGHDVRAGGLAEGRLGAAAGVDRFLFVPLGTGIAGAIGVEGRIETGAHGAAGEIGHVVVRPGGPRCGCGQYGCLEAVASASAVGRAWAEASGERHATAADAARAVVAGDPRARKVWANAVDALASGLVTALTLLDPRTLVVGGGLAEAGETLFAPLRAAVESKVTFQRVPSIVPAALGDAAGCLGAGLLAWDLLSVEVASR